MVEKFASSMSTQVHPTPEAQLVELHRTAGRKLDGVSAASELTASHACSPAPNLLGDDHDGHSGLSDSLHSLRKRADEETKQTKPREDDALSEDLNDEGEKSC